MTADGEVSLAAEAAAFVNEGKFMDAGTCYEFAADRAQDGRQKADFLKKAAGAYDQARRPELALQCLTQASGFLEGMEQADCLMDCFKAFISEIAGCEYDCNFEWPGPTEGSHSDDHKAYQETIAGYEARAEQALTDALRATGADRARVLERAREVLRERSKDGWGASRCEYIIAKVVGDPGA